MRETYAGKAEVNMAVALGYCHTSMMIFFYEKS